jgi:hypothetical protein
VAALLPLSDTRGGDIPLAGTPGSLRPLSAAPGIVPIECGKHDTTATRWYGVAIHAESEAALLDWRRDYASIRYEPFDPPADVLAGMRTYLDAMDLCYGCFDLVATAAGILAYECNPAGQYLWLEHATERPISAGIAALLAKGTV